MAKSNHHCPILVFPLNMTRRISEQMPLGVDGFCQILCFPIGSNPERGELEDSTKDRILSGNPSSQTAPKTYSSGLELLSENTSKSFIKRASGV